MERINQLYLQMIAYYAGDAKRIQHFVKVHSFSRLIGEQEQLNKQDLYILEAAALVHDIGIKVSEEKYGDCNGKHQEMEGPSVARQMLTELGFALDVIDRVCYLVAHHHTYDNITGLDYQVLIEADFLVNLHEDHSSKSAIQSALDKIFKTKTGIQLCKTMFDMEI